MSGSSSDDGTTARSVVRSVSAIVMVAGLLVSVALLVAYLDVIILFVLAGVFPTLLGFAGLSWTNALPWQGVGTASQENEEDLVAELKRRYAKGELDDAEMERKVETLLAADDDDPLTATASREREREYEF
jgi:hypothetical protein